MTLQTLTPQMHLIYEAIDALVTATKDEKADLRFADWDEAEITDAESAAWVVTHRLLALRKEYALNAQIENTLDLMGLCSGAAMRYIEDGDHESARREALWAGRFAHRYMRLMDGGVQ